MLLTSVRLVKVITLVLVLRHSVENCSLSLLFVTGLCFAFLKNKIVNQTKQFRHAGNQCHSLFQECNLGEKDWTVRIKEQLKKHFPKEEFFMVMHCHIFSKH